MKTLSFHFITDSRFDGDEQSMQNKMDQMLSALKEAFSDTKSFHLTIDKPSKYECKDPEPSFQLCTEILLQKYNKKISWDDVMRDINKIQAPKYNFVQIRDYRDNLVL